jgi:O-antigen ligase
VLFIVTIFLMSVVFQGLIMIGVHMTGKDFSIAGISTTVAESYYDTGQPLRPGGTLGSPNNAASFLSSLLIVSFGVLITRLGRWHKRLAILAFALGGIALILTQSRGGWVALATSLTVFCLVAWYRGWLSPKIFLAVAVVAVVVALLFQDIIISRLFGDDNDAAYSRIPLMELAFRMIKDHPLLGVGANNFAIMMEKYLSPNSGIWLYLVHNKYLLVWAEIGIGGLLAFIWFLFATIRRGWHCSKGGDRDLSPIALGFMAAVMGQMAHMFVDTFKDSVSVQLLCAVAGVVTAIGNLNGKSGSEILHQSQV